MHNDTQGQLEIKSSAILDLVGSNQFLSYYGYVMLLTVVPCPLPSCFILTACKEEENGSSQDGRWAKGGGKVAKNNRMQLKDCVA